MLTITLADLQAVRPIAGNLGSDRLDTYVTESRVLDLQPVLTAELLQKIDNDIASPLTYGTLVNGGTYTNKSNKICSFQGLKKVLCYYVYARLVKANQLNVTAFGATFKTDPNSQPADARTIAMMVNDAQAIADAYLSDCMLYVRDQWPTETTNSQSNGKRFKISAIDNSDTDYYSQDDPYHRN